MNSGEASQRDKCAIRDRPSANTSARRRRMKSGATDSGGKVAGNGGGKGVGMAVSVMIAIFADTHEAKALLSL